MPRCPKFIALFGLLGPGEVRATIILSDCLCALQLFRQCLLGTVELQEKRGCHGAVKFAVSVAGIHHDIIKELNASHGHCSLEDLNCAVHSRLNTGERTGGSHTEKHLRLGQQETKGHCHAGGY